MDEQETKLNIYKKLAHVQANLKAPKSAYNAFGKYSYRKAEDILEAVKPLLKEVGAVVIINDRIEVHEGWHYVFADASFIDCETQEKITATAPARESQTKKGMDDSQVTGATSSYARKYALNGLFAIDDTKDADGHENGNQEPAQQQIQPKKEQWKPKYSGRTKEEDDWRALLVKDLREFAKWKTLTDEEASRIAVDVKSTDEQVWIALHDLRLACQKRTKP